MPFANIKIYWRGTGQEPMDRKGRGFLAWQLRNGNGDGSNLLPKALVPAVG